jgi:hypothetical protein
MPAIADQIRPASSENRTEDEGNGAVVRAVIEGPIQAEANPLRVSTIRYHVVFHTVDVKQLEPPVEFEDSDIVEPLSQAEMAVRRARLFGAEDDVIDLDLP